MPGTSGSTYDILTAVEAVAQVARFVRVDEDAIHRWATGVDPDAIRPAHRPPELLSTGTPAEVARWVLLLDCLNFCFWTADSEQPWVVEHEGRQWRRYPALVACLHRGIRGDRRWLDPRRWSEASHGEVRELFAGAGCIPMLDERVQVLNQTGHVLLERFQGEALHIAEAAGYDSSRIVGLLADHFSSFRDIHRYPAQPVNQRRPVPPLAQPPLAGKSPVTQPPPAGESPADASFSTLNSQFSISPQSVRSRTQEVPILKRAQIFVSDLAAAWHENKGPAIAHLENLTAFADYRIPQMLRHLRILSLDGELESRIEAGDLIEASSPEEIELRACSIRSVELMRQAVQEHHNRQIPAWMLDEYLWEHSHDQEIAVQHHRTLTWFY